MNENWAYIKENIERFPEYKSSIFEQGLRISAVQKHNEVDLVPSQSETRFPSSETGGRKFFRTAFISGFTVGKSYTPWKRMELLTF